MSVDGEAAERAIVDRVRAALVDVKGRASAKANAQDAVRARDQAQAALDAAVRAFDGMGDEAAVREQLTTLREARDDAQTHVDQVGAESIGGGDFVIDGAQDWDRLTTDERRALIRAIVQRAVVGPGYRMVADPGAEPRRVSVPSAQRIAVELFA
jgi:hypothetical protein